MNPKFIIASIAGIGALGGGVACCYYGFRREISTKQKETPKPEATPISEQSAPQTQNRENGPAVVPEDASKLTTPSQQPVQNQGSSKASGDPERTNLPPSS